MISTLVVFVIVVGVFGGLLGHGVRRTISEVLAVLAGIVLFGGFVLSRIAAIGIFRLLFIGIALLVLMMVMIIRRIVSGPRRRRNQHGDHCCHNCYSCPQRYRCAQSYYN